MKTKTSVSVFVTAILVAVVVTFVSLGFFTKTYLRESSTGFFFKANPGQGVFMVKSLTLTPKDFIFEPPKKYFSEDEIWNFKIKMGKETEIPIEWQIFMETPSNRPIEKGFFVAKRFPFQQNKNEMGFSCYGGGKGLNTLTAHVKILEIEYFEGNISRIAFDFILFEETYDDIKVNKKTHPRWSFGSYRWNSRVPTHNDLKWAHFIN